MSCCCCDGGFKLHLRAGGGRASRSTPGPRAHVDLLALLAGVLQFVVCEILKAVYE